MADQSFIQQMIEKSLDDVLRLLSLAEKRLTLVDFELIFPERIAAHLCIRFQERGLLYTWDNLDEQSRQLFIKLLTTNETAWGRDRIAKHRPILDIIHLGFIGVPIQSSDKATVYQYMFDNYNQEESADPHLKDLKKFFPDIWCEIVLHMTPQTR